jgi:hypothetical protein
MMKVQNGTEPKKKKKKGNQCENGANWSRGYGLVILALYSCLASYITRQTLTNFTSAASIGPTRSGSFVPVGHATFDITLQM